MAPTEEHKLKVIPMAEVMNYLSDKLKGAGFEIKRISLKSEATYFGLPGCPEQLRIANHSGGKMSGGSTTPTVARITIPPNIRGHSDRVMVSTAQLNDALYRGVGRYFMAVAAKLRIERK